MHKQHNDRQLTTTNRDHTCTNNTTMTINNDKQRSHMHKQQGDAQGLQTLLLLNQSPSTSDKANINIPNRNHITIYSTN